MCGITGAYNHPQAIKIVKKGLEKIKERGRDACGYYDGKVHTAKTPGKLPSSKTKNVLGHNLHAIVGTAKQPLTYKGAVLVANAEIYNWKKLAKKYKIKAKNDSDLLLKLLVNKGLSETLKVIEGVYAFAFEQKGTLYIMRDIVGIKPLWYSFENNQLLFASEKKAIEGYANNIEELNPRLAIKYDIKKNLFSFRTRAFFAIEPTEKGEKKIILELKKRIKKSVRIRVPDSEVGLLFSGGIDSVIIAKILKDLKVPFTCYTAAASKDAPDLIYAQKVAKELNLKLKTKIITKDQTKKYLQKIIPLIEDNNVVKVGVALPLYIASEIAKNDNLRVIFSGSGADEIFAGYNRYKKADIKNLNKDCYSDLLKIYEKNTYRDDVITMNNNLELRVPFLSKEIISFGLRIDPKLKIKKDIEKYILRQVAIALKIPKEIAYRKKKAAQYGSGFDKVIQKLAKQEKKKKSAYLNQFYKTKNVKLAALVSSGKDSIYAMYTMMQQNYDISCMVTLLSKNQDSFMFQSQGVEMAKLQSKSFNIPLLEQKTSGNKEKELKDLEKVLKKAKEKYKIEGIVNGALYSNYQRERIEKICDKLGLKVFSPLWHINQEQEMRDIIKKGFRFILVKIAADGLNKDWLGKVITNKDIDKLVKLNQKIGINIAGEGGEFESLMIDGPIFTKKINIKKSTIEMEKEYIGLFHIDKASLV
jgi:diphthine-ammonia ligase